jgi:hypothetical protein
VREANCENICGAWVIGLVCNKINKIQSNLIVSMLKDILPLFHSELAEY